MGHFDLQLASLKLDAEVESMTQRLKALLQRLSDVLPYNDLAVPNTPTNSSPFHSPAKGTPAHSETAKDAGSFADASDIGRVMHEYANVKSELADVVDKLNRLRSNFTKAQKYINKQLTLPLVEQFLAHCGTARLDLLQFESVALDAAAKLASDGPDPLILNGVNYISVEVATELSRYKGKGLQLDGLPKMTAEVAKALLQSKPSFELSLNGLTSIDDEAAAVLAWHKGKLCIEAVRRLLDTYRKPWLTEHTRELLEQVQRVQDFEDLFSDPDEACINEYDRTFDEWPWTNLHPEAAAHLSRLVRSADGLGWNLNLNKVTTLNESTAGYLGKCLLHVNVHLNGVTHISETVALALALPEREEPKTLPSSGSSLSDFEREKLRQQPFFWLRDKDVPLLSLNGLEELPGDVATSLAMWKGASLRLGGLTSFGAGSIEALANWKGHTLTLSGHSLMQIEYVRSLATWQGTTLVLVGTTHLTVHVADALAQWMGTDLTITSLKDLSPKAAEALATWSGVSLDIAIPVNMSADSGAALAKWKGKYLRLHNLQDLLGETAKAIAQWKGKTLDLDGSITDLSSREAIEAVVNWDGGCLRCKCIRDVMSYRNDRLLSVEEAEVLARCRCDELDLSDFEYLDDGAAEALAKWHGKTLDLSSLLDLTANEAYSLARWKGETIDLWSIRQRVFFDENDGSGRYDAELDSDAFADYPEAHKRLFYQNLGGIPSWIEIQWYGPEENSEELDSDEESEVSDTDNDGGEPDLSNDAVDDDGEAYDVVGNDIVHRVAENGGLALFRFLIDVWESYHYEWNPNAVDRDGWTPLLLAVKNGHAQMVKELLASTPPGKIGLATPEKKNTALHWAAEIGSAKIIELLLDNGADSTVRNAEGKMPLHCAIDSGNLDAIRLLTPK
jgi:hypothetical protein